MPPAPTGCPFPGRPVTDEEIVAAVPPQVNALAAHIWPPGRMVSRPIKGALALVETAGGPASPGPSGTLQVRHATPRCAVLLHAS